MMLGAWPPLVMIPWILTSGRTCWRSALIALKVWITASSALTPCHGSAEAWAAWPGKSKFTRPIPNRSAWRMVRSRPWIIMAQSTSVKTPPSISFIFPPPPSSAGVPITWMRPLGSCPRTAASAAPAPAPEVAITLWPQAWPSPGSRSYSQRVAVGGPSAGREGGRVGGPAPRHALLHLEALGGEVLREPSGGLDLLIAELGVGVDPVGEGFQLVGQAGHGAADPIFE